MTAIQNAYIPDSPATDISPYPLPLTCIPSNINVALSGWSENYSLLLDMLYILFDEKSLLDYDMKTRTHWYKLVLHYAMNDIIRLIHVNLF
jgi:hypothetical protein